MRMGTEPGLPDIRPPHAIGQGKGVAPVESHRELPLRRAYPPMHGAQARILLAVGWDIEKLCNGYGEIGKTEHEPSREDRTEQYNSPLIQIPSFCLLLILPCFLLRAHAFVR